MTAQLTCSSRLLVSHADNPLQVEGGGDSSQRGQMVTFNCFLNLAHLKREGNMNACN